MKSLEFLDLEKKLKGCATWGDIEVAHSEADDILCQIAKSTTLSKEERKILVDLWDKVDKWYA